MSEINRIIATKVMGWTLEPPNMDSHLGWWKGSPEEFDLEDFDPLHRIEHAIMALEKYRKDNPKHLIKLAFWPDGSTTCTIYPTTISIGYIADKEAATPSAAICEAIVEAVKGA
jgi:hypothetical protein